MLFSASSYHPRTHIPGITQVWLASKLQYDSKGVEGFFYLEGEYLLKSDII